jgi:hypothetical protein
VGGGIVGVREGWECQQEGKKKEAEGFYAAFYGSSPTPGKLVVLESTFSSDADDTFTRW